MNLRSSGTSTFSANCFCSVSKLLLSRSVKTSAIATSLIGPGLVDIALPAAPLPRPPQPTSATWMALFSAAWTCGMTAPARAEAAAMRPVLLRNSRRDVTVCRVSFIEPIVCRPMVCCQRLMFVSWIFARGDEAEAQLKLGMNYEKGWNVTVDRDQAAEWYLRAADQGST